MTAPEVTTTLIDCMPTGIRDIIEDAVRQERAKGSPLDQGAITDLAEQVVAKYPWFEDLLYSEISRIENSGNARDATTDPLTIAIIGFSAGAAARLAGKYIERTGK